MSLSPFGCAQDEQTKSYQCGDAFVLSLPKHEREWGGDALGCAFAQRPLREYALFQALIKPHLAHIDLRPMAR